MKQYTPPSLVEFGDVQDLTAADFTNSQQDIVFFNGTPVSTSQGSQDACVANPPTPGSTCEG